MSDEKHHHLFHHHKEDGGEQVIESTDVYAAGNVDEYEKARKEEKHHKHMEEVGGLVYLNQKSYGQDESKALHQRPGLILSDGVYSSLFQIDVQEGFWIYGHLDICRVYLTFSFEKGFGFKHILSSALLQSSSAQGKKACWV